MVVLTDIHIEFANRVALEVVEPGGGMMERVVCKDIGAGVEWYRIVPSKALKPFWLVKKGIESASRKVSIFQ